MPRTSKSYPRTKAKTKLIIPKISRRKLVKPQSNKIVNIFPSSKKLVDEPKLYAEAVIKGDINLSLIHI